MDKRDYLSQAYFMDKEIEAKQEQIEKLESVLIYTGVNMSDTKTIGSSSSKDDLICKVIDLKDLLVKDICKLVYIKHCIIENINEIEDSLFRTILIEKYINFMTFEDIAEKLNYSERQISRLHKKALDLILNQD